MTKICAPGFNKYNWLSEDSYSSNLQRKTGDVFIMRMAEVYLIAAEANQQLGNGEKAAEYLNVLKSVPLAMMHLTML